MIVWYEKLPGWLVHHLPVALTVISALAAVLATAYLLTRKEG